MVSYLINQRTWCAYKTPLVLDNCLQLCICICRFILMFGLSTLLHACFWGILHSMLGKMEIVSGVVPFDRNLTLLEVIGLHDFRCAVNFTSLHRLWHLCNLPCTYTLFLLVSIVRNEFKDLSIGSPGTKINMYIFRANILLCILCCDAGPGYSD